MRASSKLFLMWGVAILLFAATLSVGGLGADAYSYDELRSLIVAGGAQYGPLLYPSEVLARLMDQSPDQALGFAMVLRPWGELVGWSEFATRVLPWLAGTLAIAVTARAGRDLFDPVAGIAAALVLGSSAYYLSYTHKLRVFTLVALAVSGALWCYWRIILSGRRAGPLVYAGLALSGAGLLLTHYFAAPLLVVLGVYHLTVRPKDRRWWTVTGVAALIGAAFIPVVPVILEGVALNQTREGIAEAAVTPWEVPLLAARYFGNGGALLTLVVLALGAWGMVRPPIANTRRNAQFVWWCLIGMLLGVIAMNAAASVMTTWRVRYMMPLWVPLSLLAGLGVWVAYAHARYTAVILMGAWVIGGGIALATDFMVFSQGDNAPVEPWQAWAAPMFADGEPGDAYILLGERFGYHAGHYTHGLSPRAVIPFYEGRDEMAAAVDGALRVWSGVHTDESPSTHIAAFDAVLAEGEFIRCASVIDEPPLTLVLYAVSPAFCPNPPEPSRAFGPHLTLADYAVVRTADNMTVNLGWTSTASFDHAAHSVSVRVIEGDIAQDVGFGSANGPFTPMQVTLAGARTQDVCVIVYNWQTGDRVSGPGDTTCFPLG